MIVIVQRLLQLVVLGALVFVVARPAVLPEPGRSMAENAHVFVMGEADTWESFQSTWKQRFEQLGALIPWFKQVATTIPPEPPQITADGILNLFNQIIITQPVRKFDAIKQDLLMTAPASSSGASLYNEQHE